MNFTDNTFNLYIDYYGEARLFGVLNPARLYLQSLAPDFKTAGLRMKGMIIFLTIYVKKICLAYYISFSSCVNLRNKMFPDE